MQPFDPKMIPLDAAGSLALSRHLLDIKEQDFLVTLADHQIVVKAKWLMVNLFAWRPLVKRGMPVYSRHTLREGLVTKEVLAQVATEIYCDVVQLHKQNGGVSPQVERDILGDLCETVNDLHTMVATQLGAYHVSISIFELAELLEQPEIAPLTKVDISAEMSVSISAAEEKLKLAGNAIVDKLRDRTIPSNIIAPFLELGLLSAKQLPRVLVALGFRTDAADTLIRYPITSSYVDGIQNIQQFAVESLDAKKTIYYNRNAMPDSQYSNRKQQLLAAVVRRLYPGSCGSRLTVPFYVHQDNYKHVVDKNIIENGEIVTLTKRNVSKYVCQTVEFLSPLTCRHTDGICHACGGQLTDFMPPHSVVGIASTVEYMSAASQLVLSAKHFSLTSAIAFKIPDQLHDILMVRQNDIYIRPNVDLSGVKVGVQFRDMAHINDLQALDEESVIGEQQFSNINYITFATEDDNLISGEVAMSSDGTIPYFSSEMLAYIKDNFKNVAVGDMIWIPLKRFDHINEPLLRCVIESNSMIKFNKTLEKFTTSDIKNFTSLPDVLRAFTDIVYKEINTNIMHIEVVLKSYLITNESNYNIPVVSDINAVRFSDLESIIPRRSLGEQYAFEQLLKFLSDPATFVLPHKKGIFDNFFYTDS